MKLILLLVLPCMLMSQQVELPESISLGLLKNIFHPVYFPHRDHAHMSGTGIGCVTCHHYAEDDIYDPCADCHTNRAEEQTADIPSLNAAFHRKCLACHREWSQINVCGSCHIKREEPIPQEVLEMAHAKKADRSRYPALVIYDTGLGPGPRVHFRHDQHVQLFRFDCSNCHMNESCTTCHGGGDVPESMLGEAYAHHNPCSSCHDVEQEDNCSKCHREQASAGFSHDLTAFPLKSFHASLECIACHDPQTHVQKLDRTCTTCHQNFELGEFDHMATGLVLELGHEEFDCYECHIDDRFDQPPSCYECHEDELSFPEDLPGYRAD